MTIVFWLLVFSLLGVVVWLFGRVRRLRAEVMRLQSQIGNHQALESQWCTSQQEWSMRDLACMEQLQAINLLLQQEKERCAHLEGQVRDKRSSEVLEGGLRITLLADVRHKIQIPLSEILGQCEVLTALESDAERMRLIAGLHKIHRAGTLLADFLTQILDLARLEAGSLELQSMPFSFAAVLDEVVKRCQPSIRENGNALSVVAPEDYGVLYGDRARVKQVLVQLLNHVNRSMRHGEIGLEVREQATEASGRWLEVAISDTGMDAEGEKRTQLLVRRLSSMEGVYSSCGCGIEWELVICKRLVERMGGGIRVESEPDMGNVFRLTWPFACQPAWIGSQSMQLAGLPVMLVLLVEDERLCSELTEALLVRFGWRVMVASRPEEGLDLVRSHCFDLVLLDLHLPGMDGLEWTRCLRRLSDPVKASLPVVALTADVMSVSMRACLDAGMSAVMAKPLDEERLLKAMKRIMGGEERGWLSLRSDERSQVDPDVVFDPALLDGALASLGMERVRMLGERFEELCAQVVQQMTTASQCLDGEEMGRIAHLVNGAAEHLGLRALAHRARRMARMAPGHPEEAVGDGEELLRLLQLSRQALKLWFGALAPSV